MPVPPSSEAASGVAPVESVDTDDRLEQTALAAEPFFLMARASSRGSAGANRVLADLDLKVRSYSVLALACSGEQPTQRELSQFLVLDPSQIVAIIDQLERRGAVARRPDARDRRSKIIVPTEAGQTLYAEARQRVAEASDGLLAVLTADEQDQLFRLLRKAAFPPETASA